MNYFEANFKQKPVFSNFKLKKWVFDKSFTPQKEQLKQKISRIEYNKNSLKYQGLQWIKKEFFCANISCKSENVECIWFLYQPIDMCVDETFAEFYCPSCKKYTFVKYYRDDS